MIKIDLDALRSLPQGSSQLLQNSFWEELMEVTITLTDKEVTFLQRIITELNNYQKKQNSIEDAVHECIRMAAFEESEERA